MERQPPIWCSGGDEAIVMAAMHMLCCVNVNVATVGTVGTAVAAVNSGHT